MTTATMPGEWRILNDEERARHKQLYAAGQWDRMARRAHRLGLNLTNRETVTSVMRTLHRTDQQFNATVAELAEPFAEYRALAHEHDAEAIARREQKLEQAKEKLLADPSNENAGTYRQAMKAQPTEKETRLAELVESLGLTPGEFGEDLELIAEHKRLSKELATNALKKAEQIEAEAQAGIDAWYEKWKAKGVTFPAEDNEKLALMAAWEPANTRANKLREAARRLEQIKGLALFTGTPAAYERPRPLTLGLAPN